MSYRRALGALVVGAIIGTVIAGIVFTIASIVLFGEPFFEAALGGVGAGVGGFLITMGVGLLGVVVHALIMDV